MPANFTILWVLLFPSFGGIAGAIIGSYVSQYFGHSNLPCGGVCRYRGRRICGISLGNPFRNLMLD